MKKAPLSPERSPVLEVDGLEVDFETGDGRVRAVRGLSYRLGPGETLGVVGESGSGKSVTHLAMLGLLPDTAEVRAERLRFQGNDLPPAGSEALRRLRGRGIGMIFQDPMTSLNPFLTLGTQIAEMARIHLGLRGAALRETVVAALAEVGIPNPELRIEQYPHEFSGGMRQRAMIAMMLVAEPALLFADEPTTALDVTVQAQILGLLASLQERRGMSIVLITHDLGVVAGFAHRILVMYAGRVVEEAPTPALFANPSHPYTRGLLRSIPRLDEEREELEPIPGQPPDLLALPEGCPFAPRCPSVRELCLREEPGLRSLEDGHALACHVDLEPFDHEERS